MSQCVIKIVWLDQIYDRDVHKPECIATYLSLCKIDPYLTTFHNVDTCLDYINNLSNNHENMIFLCISNEKFSPPINALLQVCEERTQIASIYILCESFDTNIDFFEISTKLRLISTGLELILKELNQLPYRKQKRREDFNRLDFIINSIPSQSSSTVYDDTITSAKLDLELEFETSDRQEAEFFYGEFIREILVELSSSEQEMIQFCRQKYVDSATDLKIVEEFEDYYDTCNAIFWYTRDTFLYRLLNQALREQDIDTLYSLRYFIKDLHSQLETQHKSQQHTNVNNSLREPTVDMVYRGQLMVADEFDRKIRDNIGGFFSVTSFFSTTLYKERSLRYAGDGNRFHTDNECSVLFQINTDKKVNKCPYADITTESVFEEEESEVLFTMGAVFRIMSVVEESAGFWIVELSLTNDEDEELRAVSEYMRDDLLEPFPLQRLAQLFFEMGKYNKAEQYYLMFLQDPDVMKDFKLTSIVLNDLGLIYHETNQLEKSIEYYNKALELKVKHLPETDPSFSVTYNNLGEIYREQGDSEKALFHYKKAIFCHNKALASELNASSPPSKSLLGTYYNNIGLVYQDLQRHSDALQMFQKCLEMDLKNLPRHHPQLSITLNNISQIHYDLGNYEKAVEYLRKTLEIEHRSLPPTHPTIGHSYSNLAKALYGQDKKQEALHYMKKAYDIDLENFGSDSPKVIADAAWMARVENELPANEKNTREEN